MKFKLIKILILCLLVSVMLCAVCCKKNKKPLIEIESVAIVESQTETTMQSETTIQSEEESVSIEESQSQEEENSQPQSDSQSEEDSQISESEEESETVEFESQLFFKTFTLDGRCAYATVTSEVTNFDFTTEIIENGSSSYLVAYDQLGQECVANKTVTLNEGDNVFYILETLDGEIVATYTVTICKTNAHIVTFYLFNNTVYQVQILEEGGFIAVPEPPTSLAHEVTYWDYDFSIPITQATDIFLVGEEKAGMSPFEYESDERECKIIGLKDRSVQEITIPSYVTEISSEAFKDVVTLNRVIINAPLSEIKDATFKGCVALESIVIPEGVTTIGARAFYDCRNLQTVKLPSTLTSLKTSAFQGCKLLKEIEIPRGITSLSALLFKDCLALERVEIPDTVTYIYAECFFGCKALRKVQIPNSVTSIAGMTFTNCQNLTEVELSENLTQISDFLFQQCESLSYIEIPNSVTRIGNSAFLNCYSLARIKIGRQVNEIDARAFDWCTNLAKVLYCGSKTEWQDIDILDYGNAYVTNYASIYYYTENPQDLPLDDDNYWCYDQEGNIKELAIFTITVSDSYTQKAREGASVTIQLPTVELLPGAQMRFIGWVIQETGLQFGANINAITLVVTGDITILPVFEPLPTDD